MENNLQYSQWEQENTILYLGQSSSFKIKKSQQEKVVQKRIVVTQQNKKYTQIEISIMRQINSDYVVKYLKHMQNPEERTIYLYMPYYPNGDLQEYLLKNPKLDFQRRLNMFVDILMGLMELHSRFIIHRDLKLKNIFVDKAGRCVVGDLGIATVTEKSAISRLGTVGNQAPEVYNTQNYDEKVDIWAAGIIAYQLFNEVKDGAIPYPFQSPQQHRSALLELGGGINYKYYLKFTSEVKPFNIEIPQKLKDLILRMLKNNPKQRISWIQFYQTYALFELSGEKEERLIPFKAEYERMVETKLIIKQYIGFIQDFRITYYSKLQKMLSKQNIKSISKDQHFKSYIHDLHIFFYLLMRKALSKYQYIKEKRIYRAIVDLKQFMKSVKDSQYHIQLRINIWLKQEQEKQIAKNPKYLKNQYFYALQTKIDHLLHKFH